MCFGGWRRISIDNGQTWLLSEGYWKEGETKTEKVTIQFESVARTNYARHRFYKKGFEAQGSRL